MRAEGDLGELIKRVQGQKIKLEGFNNLTKSLSFNIYDICYARSRESQIEYLEYIDEEYNSGRLETIVAEVTRIINARLVHISTQDYDPRGASVVALLNEEHSVIGAGAPYMKTDFSIPGGCEANPASQACLEAPKGLPAEQGMDPAAGLPRSITQGLVDEPARTAPSPLVVGHLDKSHIAIHTYPEYNHLSGIASFRVDVDIATCGMISPLSALPYLIESFEAEVVVMDYKVRGFTRDNLGRKLFIDHDISSIQDYITDDILRDYVAYDINIVSDNNFHTKMRKREIRLSEFLFGGDVTNLVPAERKRIKKALELEVQEIFECKALNARGG
jgi:S-adenosylmethionine decarboxylase